MAQARNRRIAAFALAAGMLGTAASAETLEDALALAYETNPGLQSQRSALRSQDEGFVQARSAGLPNISASISGNRTETDSSGTFVDPNSGTAFPTGGSTQSGNATYNLTARQNLYRGGRTGAAMDEALANIMSGRASLHAQEQSVLIEVVNAYTAVRRDETILEVRQNNVAVLERQLQETQDRFEVGEITRTDVSQAEARLAAARSSLASAQATLTASRSAYERIVGRAPGTLEPPPPLPVLPASLDEAIAIAMESNPDLVSAQYAEDAAKASVRGSRGAFQPSASLTGSLNHREAIVGLPSESDSASVTANVSIPLYSGNQLSSALRSSREAESRARLGVRSAERSVRDLVMSNWSAYRAAQLQIEANQEQVRAAELALEGVQAEATVDLRTTLDVLNAEQELLNARLALVQSEQSAYVAAFRVLQSVGGVDPELWNLDVDIYDPTDNFRRVRRSYIGIGILE
jgi:outer membrane protein